MDASALDSPAQLLDTLRLSRQRRVVVGGQAAGTVHARKHAAGITRGGLNKNTQTMNY